MLLIQILFLFQKKKSQDYTFNIEENNLIDKMFLIEEIDSFKTEQLISKNKDKL